MTGLLNGYTFLGKNHNFTFVHEKIGESSIMNRGLIIKNDLIFQGISEILEEKSECYKWGHY